MTTRWLCEGVTRRRRVYSRHGVPRYVVDNGNDDHATRDREDYSVALEGVTPPAAGFENVEQTASCEIDQVGDPVMVAAGQYGAATQAEANAAALAAAEAGLSCHWENDEQTASCEEGYTGDDVVIAAGEYTSLVSKADANAQALAAAEAGLECELPTFGGQTGGTTGQVLTMAVQNDGLILVAGNFSTIGGVAQPFLARIYPDGTVDETFAPVFNNNVDLVRVISGGRILCAGGFTLVNGQSDRQGICILASDGTLDPFAAQVNVSVSENGGDICEMPNGDIILAASPTTVNGVSAGGRDLIRFSSAGVFDTSFTVLTSSPSHAINAILPYANGKLLCGGPFTGLAGEADVFYLGLLNSDGSLDTGFTSDANAQVRRLRRAEDGNIWVCGDFSQIAGQTRSRFAKLNEAGADQGFSPVTIAGGGDQVGDIAEQTTGDVVISGWFATVDGVTINHVARLTAAGARDTGWPDVSSTFGNASNDPRMRVIGNDYVLLGVSLNETVLSEDRDGLALLTATGSLVPLP